MAGLRERVGRWIAGQKSLPGRFVEYETSAGTCSWGGLQIPADPYSDYGRLFRVHVWTYVCIRTLTMATATIPIMVQTKRKDAWEDDPNSPLQRILDDVNPEMTSFGFQEATMGYLKAFGNAFWYMIRDRGGRPAELWPMRPDMVKAKPGTDRMIGSYEYGPEGSATTFPAEDVLHLRYWDPVSAFFGTSPITPLAESITVNLYARAFTKKFFQNSAVPEGVLSTQDDDLPQAELRKLKRMWEDQVKGIDNAHRTVIMPRGVEWKALTIPPPLAGIGDIAQWSLQEILAGFGLNPIIVGWLENATLANVREQRRDWYENKLLPELGLIDALLVERLAPELGLDKASVRIRRVTDSIAVLRENEQGLSKRMLAEVAAGVRSLNEYREALHVGPPIAGGDIYCLPANMVPITEVGASAALPPGKGYTKALHTTDWRGLQRKSALAFRRQAVKAEAAWVATYWPIVQGELRALLDDVDYYTAGDPFDHDKWARRFSAQDGALMPPLGEAMNAAALAYYSSVLHGEPGKALAWRPLPSPPRERGGNGHHKAPSPAPPEAWPEWLKPDLQPVASPVGVVEIGEPLVGTPDPATALDIAARPNMLKLSQQLASVPDDLFDVVRRELALGHAEAENAEQLARRLEEAILGSMEREGWRAKRVARTEMHGALQAGEFTAIRLARDEGIAKAKSWQCSFLPESRESHMSADGQERDVDEPFTIGGESLDHPGDPAGSASNVVHCVCYMHTELVD